MLVLPFFVPIKLKTIIWLICTRRIWQQLPMILCTLCALSLMDKSPADSTPDPPYPKHGNSSPPFSVKVVKFLTPKITTWIFSPRFDLMEKCHFEKTPLTPSREGRDYEIKKKKYLKSNYLKYHIPILQNVPRRYFLNIYTGSIIYRNSYYFVEWWYSVPLHTLDWSISLIKS